MRTLIAWLYFWGVFFRYPLYKLGLIERPMWINRSDLSQLAWGQMIRWNRRIRVVHGERCPQEHPAVFVCNHVKLDDPFWVWRSVHRATQERLFIRFVARDDYFAGPPWDYFPVNVNELLEMGGTILISREGFSLSQLKPLMKILESPGSFVLFPGRTRSRSGLVFEYREGIEEPGSASFFLTQVQRRNPESGIVAAPLARTHHPVSKVSAMVFGAPLHLARGADRAAQRALDFAITEAIGGLVEVNGPHLVAGVLYLRALHGLPPELPLGQLVAEVARIRDMLSPATYVHPDLVSRLEDEVMGSVHFFSKSGLVGLRGDACVSDTGKILHCPPLETGYRKANPVKFQVNQILHLREVTDALEAVVLGTSANTAQDFAE